MTNPGTMSCPDHPGSYLEETTYLKHYKCDGCKMRGIGQGCRCKNCKYVLHMGCKYPSGKISPLFLSNVSFKFKKEPPTLPPCPKGPKCKGKHERLCDACGKTVDGFVYSSDSGLDLHPCCAMLETHISIDGVSFKLNKEKKPKKCHWCKLKVVKGNDKEIPGWFYESENHDYHYHVFCIMDMAVHCASMAEGHHSLALEKLDQLPLLAEKRRSGGDENKYWRILKVLITTVLSIVFGDPTTILAKLAVEALVQLLN